MLFLLLERLFPPILYLPDTLLAFVPRSNIPVGGGLSAPPPLKWGSFSPLAQTLPIFLGAYDDFTYQPQGASVRLVRRMQPKGWGMFSSAMHPR